MGLRIWGKLLYSHDIAVSLFRKAVCLCSIYLVFCQRYLQDLCQASISISWSARAVLSFCDPLDKYTGSRLRNMEIWSCITSESQNQANFNSWFWLMWRASQGSIMSWWSQSIDAWPEHLISFSAMVKIIKTRRKHSISRGFHNK